VLFEDVFERCFVWGVEVLKRFVSIPTVNPPGEGFKEFVDVASHVLRELGFGVEVYEVLRDEVARFYPEYGGYPRFILIARYGSGKPVLHFNGHYDVVPPGSGWVVDPFNPVVKDGKLYGRGSVDMKGGIVAALIAVKTFLELHKEFRGSIEFALVPDEEIGGETGTGYLVRHGLSSPDYVVIPEPSGSNRVWIGHRGALWFYIEIFGRQAHGSTPWLGVNAFEYMVKIAEKFMNEYRRVIEARRSKYTYDDSRGAVPTITIGGEVRGGAKINIVPGYMAFSVDRRIIVEESVEDVENEVKNFVEKLRKEFPEIGIELKIVNRLPPALTDPESYLVKKLVNAIEKATGTKPSLTVCLGGLDMRFYTERGIQTVAYGPGPLHMAHQANEYVSLEEIKRVAKAYYLLLKEILLQ